MTTPSPSQPPAAMGFPPTAVPLSPREPAQGAYRRVLANLAATIEERLAGTLDETDPEDLHELRVAVRRTRSVLRRADGVLPDDVRATYTEEFAWLGDITGPARDLDVYVLQWDDLVAPLSVPLGALDPVVAELELQRRAAHASLTTDLRSDRFADLMARWQAWLAHPGPSALGAEPVGPLVAKHVKKAQRRLLTEGRAIDRSSPAEQLHDLRKDAKKLRYLVECFGGVFAPKPRKAFVKHLKALQENLGAHQDADVQAQQLRLLAADLHQRSSLDAATLVAMGQLVEVLEQRRAAERKALAKRFAAYDSKATAKALEKLLHPAKHAARLA